MLRGAVGKARRQAGAHRRVDVRALVAEAHGQQGVLSQVELGDAVDQLRVLLVAVHPGFLGLEVGDQAPAYIAGFGQRAGHIEAGAVAVPVTGFSQTLA